MENIAYMRTTFLSANSSSSFGSALEETEENAGQEAVSYMYLLEINIVRHKNEC